MTLKVNNSPDSFAICSITPGVISDKSLNDGNYNYTVWPGGGDPGDFTYTATCTGGGGTVTDNLTITVENTPPVPTDLSVVQGDYCTIALRPIFSWTFTDPDPGDTQGAYRVQADNNSNFSSPEIDSNKVSSASESYAPIGGLSYNNTYYWRLKVWDNYDIPSNWTQGPSFNTPLHAYPDPDFNWTPLSPSEEEIIQFCSTQEAGTCPEDNSTCYTTAGPIPSPSCSGKTFLWTFPAEAEFATGSSPTTENPRVKFADSGSYTITLQITDDIGTCPKSYPFNVAIPLPEWKEVEP